MRRRNSLQRRQLREREENIALLLMKLVYCVGQSSVRLIP